jgi:hypothetical protein
MLSLARLIELFGRINCGDLYFIMWFCYKDKLLISRLKKTADKII